MRAANDVFSAPADVLAWRNRVERADRPGSGCPVPRRPTRLAARRRTRPERRAGHDAHGLAGRDRAVERTSRQRVADDGQRSRYIRRRAFGAFGDHRVAVHRRAIESRHVHVADDGFSQHSARRRGERHGLGAAAAATARRATPAPGPPYGAAQTRASGRHFPRRSRRCASSSMYLDHRSTRPRQRPPACAVPSHRVEGVRLTVRGRISATGSTCRSGSFAADRHQVHGESRDRGQLVRRDDYRRITSGERLLDDRRQLLMPSTSKPPSGSSMSNNRGSAASARAIATR